MPEHDITHRIHSEHGDKTEQMKGGAYCLCGEPLSKEFQARIEKEWNEWRSRCEHCYCETVGSIPNLHRRCCNCLNKKIV